VFWTLICYERAESFCNSLNQPRLLFMALMAQWRHSDTTGKLSEALQIAERLYSLAQEQNNPTLMIEAYRALATTLYFLGDFETARQFAIGGIEIWRSGTVQSQSENLDAPAATCLCYEALCAWHFGQIAASRPNVAEAISLSKEMNDMHGLAATLYYAGSIAYLGRNRAEVERFASDVIELATRQHFAHWLALGSILRGWAHSASGDTAEGVSWIEDGIRDFRATGAMVGLPYLLGMKAEALYLADRTSEALEVIREAETLGARSGESRWCAELHRLRGVFLAAMGADENQIEASFGEAIRIAREQKSVSLEKRAERTYAEYHSQKASRSGGRGFRLPLW
jgi:adenylate cyclase